MSSFQFLSLAAMFVTTSGLTISNECPTIVKEADCTPANRCLPSGTLTLDASNNGGCYSILTGTLTVNPGFTGVVNALGPIGIVPTPPPACNVNLNSGVAIANLNNNGCTVTGSVASLGGYSSNGGKTTITAATFPGKQAVSVNGGSTYITFVATTTLESIQINGGMDVQFTFPNAGSVGRISVNGGTASVLTPATIGEVSVNGGTLKMGATGSIGAVRQNGGSITVTAGKPSSYTGLGGTCIGCPPNSFSF